MKYEIKSITIKYRMFALLLVRVCNNKRICIIELLMQINY